MSWILIVSTIVTLLCVSLMIFSHFRTSLDALLRISLYEKSFCVLLITICLGFVVAGGLWPVDKEVKKLEKVELCRTSNTLFIELIERPGFIKKTTKAKFYNAENEDIYIKKEIYYNSYGIAYAKDFEIKIR